MDTTQDCLRGKNLSFADEIRSFDKGKMEVVFLDNVTVRKATFEPRRKWSEPV
jgi:hypothetical protein